MNLAADRRRPASGPSGPRPVVGGVPVPGGHEAGRESSREAHRAFIPSPNEALGGLHKVNADMVSFEPFALRSSHVGHGATLVETHKQQALYSYKKYKAISL